MLEEFIADLYSAYGNVPLRYLSKGVIHSLRGNRLTTQEIERVFMAELYHQWRKIMELKPMLYSNLILHSEIGKVIHSNRNQKPDLVLHGGQVGPNRMTQNKLLVELKMSSFDIDDFNKIYYSIVNLNYSGSVYIIHNMRKNNFKDSLNNVITKYPEISSNYFSRIYFINSNDGVFNLNEILNQ